MSERDYNLYYSPLPLIQRDGVSTSGRVAPSRAASAYAAASDLDEVRTASDRPYHADRPSLRVVEGTRESSRTSSRRRGDSRRQERVEQSRSNRTRGTKRSGGLFSNAYDDFDDYYAAYDDEDAYAEPTAFVGSDYADSSVGYGNNGYGLRMAGYGQLAGFGEGGNGYDDGDDFYDDRASTRDAARSRRDHGHAAAVYSPRPRARSFSLLEILTYPLVAIGSLVTRHIRFCFFVLAIAFVVVMLFAPVRKLYIAHRQLDELQATYDALEAENQAIRNEIEVLQTREGIENEAREHGYVSEGETKVIVEGLPELEEEYDPMSSYTSTETPDERPWYVRFFDEVFGYEVGE